MTSTFEDFFNGRVILEDKGIGRKLGNLKVNSRDYPLYEKRVNLTKQLSSGEYGVIISKNIYYITGKKLVENKEEDGIEVIYIGFDKNKAINFFNKIVEDDKNEKLRYKIKPNLIYKIFSEN
ncbi:hypothetical protein HYS72_03330 [Candidatus Pacearchaeota archaeon]|nr:hypothetical protein [Candidatus Pacearchaeota archaeon]MBI2056888.1 hypothetical protein [Candidatus Pacearchaeota archaeon]